MPAVSLEQSVRTMLLTLSNTIVPDSRITHGYRLQESDLPAITFDVQQKAFADTAGAYSTANVRVTIIADTTLDVLDIEPQVRSIMVPGSYGRVFHAVVGIESTLSEPVVGTGDEQEPATMTIESVIYWS